MGERGARKDVLRLHRADLMKTAKNESFCLAFFPWRQELKATRSFWELKCSLPYMWEQQSTAFIGEFTYTHTHPFGIRVWDLIDLSKMSVGNPLWTMSLLLWESDTCTHQMNHFSFHLRLLERYLFFSCETWYDCEVVFFSWLQIWLTSSTFHHCVIWSKVRLEILFSIVRTESSLKGLASDRQRAKCIFRFKYNGNFQHLMRCKVIWRLFRPKENIMVLLIFNFSIVKCSGKQGIIYFHIRNPSHKKFFT